MRKLLQKVGVTALLFAMALPAVVTATAVRHMNLDALTNNAGAIFRGTVTAVSVGTIEAGGGELPTTTYAFRVDEMFKGEPTTVKDGQAYMTLTILGSPKADTQTGDIQRLSVLRDIPQMEIGSEYLLFATPESDIGLTVTVGVSQGCFDLVGGMALNRAQNLGLFEGASVSGPARGPIEYRTLADNIRTILGTP